MTPQEINEAVARKLGWTHFKINEGGRGKIPFLRGKRPGTRYVLRHRVPDYCHSIEAAWEIVEKFPDIGLLKHGDQWEVTNGFADAYEEIISKADTAPMAICLAFLKLP